uniref:Ig-like domain-containing protein n=1 Tax=Yersinia enterocolitica TaxID=630 RepID=UPI001C8E91E4
MNVNKVFANEDSIVDLSSLGSKNEVNIFISGPDMNIVTPQGVTVIVNGALYSSIKGNKLSVKFNDGSFSGSQLVSSVDLKNIKLDRIDSALVESDDNSYKKNIDAKNKAEAAKEQTKLQQKIEEAKKAEEAADKAKNEANKAISEMVEAQNASKEIENMLSDFLGDIAAKGSMAQVSDNQAIEAQDIKVTKQEDESPISIKPININTGKGRSNSSSKSDHISDEPVLPKNISVSLKLENSSNSGSKNDMLTNVGMPKFIGTTEPNSTIIIKLDKISIGQLVSDSLGNFDFSSPIELGEGNCVFSVDATDVNGATGTTQLAISVDKTTVAPTFELSAEDKAVAVNNLTAKSNPTIIGTAEKEGVVEIYVGGKLVASENVNAQGEWEHQFKKGVLAEGNNAIKLIAVDKADNRATLNGTIELDTIPPEKPTIALDTQSDSGLKNDNLTNIKQPVFVGKSELGSKVTLFLGSKHLADITGGENGVWTFSQPTQLTDGKYTLRVIASDLAGNKSEEGALHFEIDTVISKFSASIVDKDDSGVIGDNITNVLNPKLSGMTEPSCEIEATNKNTGETVKTSSNKKGVWNLSFLKDSVEGINNLSFNVIDKAGNTEDYSFSYHVDTVAPAAPIVALDSFVTLPNGKFATREKLPVFVGSAEPGSTVLIMVDGRDNISVKVGANGKLEYSFPDKFLDGNYSVDFLAMDTAGNHSPKKNYSFTIQTETAIPTAELDPADDSSIKGDWITNKQSGLTLTGTAQQFSTVKVYVANNLVGTKFADEAGQWTLDIIQSFPDDEYKVKIETEDKLGFSSSASYDLVIDSFIIQPSIKLHDSSDTGIKDDNITKVAEPLFTGKAEANSTLTLYINDVLHGETVARKDGVWNIITKSGLGDGVHRAVVKAEDAAGNKSDSLVYKFEVITSTITPTIELFNDTGFDTNDNITKENTPHLTGTAAAYATVKIFAGTKLVGNTAADKNGLWDYTFSHARKLDDGEYNVSASVEDVAGNTARSDDFIIKVDTTLSIPVIELSSISDTGVLGDYLTNSTKPVLLIKNTDSDIREIQVWDEFNNTHIGMATRSNKGIWSYNFIDDLSEGEHRFYIKAEDIAGNQCNSLPFVLTVDTQLSVPTIALMPGEDSGVNKTDNKTNLTQPKFILDSFDTDVDESKIKVEMTDGNQTHLLAVTKNGGQWVATTSADWADGDYQ